MNVKVNDCWIQIFTGAQVKDVIRKYSTKEYKKIKNDKKEVQDKQGNKVMLSGELIGNEKLFIVDKK